MNDNQWAPGHEHGEEPQDHPCFVCWQETKDVDKCHAGDAFYFVLYEPAMEHEKMVDENGTPGVGVLRRALCTCCLERVCGTPNEPASVDAIGKLFIPAAQAN
jgi:hypothetical protein